VQLTQKVEIQQAPAHNASSSKEEVLVLVVAVLFTVSLVVPASNILLSDLFNSDKAAAGWQLPHDMFHVCEWLM